MEPNIIDFAIFMIIGCIVWLCLYVFVAYLFKKYKKELKNAQDWTLYLICLVVLLIVLFVGIIIWGIIDIFSFLFLSRKYVVSGEVITLFARKKIVNESYFPSSTFDFQSFEYDFQMAEKHKLIKEMQDPSSEIKASELEFLWTERYFVFLRGVDKSNHRIKVEKNEFDNFKSLRNKNPKIQASFHFKKHLLFGKWLEYIELEPSFKTSFS